MLLLELREQGSYYLEITNLTTKINHETEVKSKVEEDQGQKQKLSTIIRTG